MTYTVDRCYDRYLIAFSLDSSDSAEGDLAEGLTLKMLWDFQKDALKNVLEDHLQAGRLRSCKIDESRGNTLNIDFEAVSGSEDMIAGAIDAISTSMVTIAEYFPDGITIEI